MSKLLAKLQNFLNVRRADPNYQEHAKEISEVADFLKVYVVPYDDAICFYEDNYESFINENSLQFDKTPVINYSVIQQELDIQIAHMAYIELIGNILILLDPLKMPNHEKASTILATQAKVGKILSAVYKVKFMNK